MSAVIGTAGPAQQTQRYTAREENIRGARRLESTGEEGSPPYSSTYSTTLCVEEVAKKLFCFILSNRTKQFSLIITP